MDIEITKKESKVPYSKKNYILFFIGLIIIALGYIAMAQEPHNSFLSLYVSPVLLLFGYIVVIPIALVKKFK